MTTKRIRILIAATAGVLALGGYAYYANRVSVFAPPVGGDAAAAEPAGKPAPPGQPAIGVETIRVSSDTFLDSVSAVGTLKSNESVVLRPEIAGRVAEIRFREGAAVTRGDVLLTLDASTQSAELQQARANLGLARANLLRTEELFEKKFVSARARDEASANMKVLEAALALAQARYDKTQIRAPFAGVVGIRRIAVGEYVRDGQELVNLEDIATLKADFHLPENLLPKVRKGQAVEVSTDALPGAVFKGTVDAIDPMLDPSGRAVQLRARLPNPQMKLRPGMFVRVRLVFGDERRALAVPEQALVPEGKDSFVFKVAAGKAQRVRVKVGQRRGTSVEILEGLAEGDEIVTAGQLKLRDGVPVLRAVVETASNAEIAETQSTQR